MPEKDDPGALAVFCCVWLALLSLVPVYVTGARFPWLFITGAALLAGMAVVLLCPEPNELAIRLRVLRIRIELALRQLRPKQLRLRCARFMRIDWRGALAIGLMVIAAAFAYRGEA